MPTLRRYRDRSGYYVSNGEDYNHRRVYRVKPEYEQGVRTELDGARDAEKKQGHWFPREILYKWIRKGIVVEVDKSSE